jgi:hypothetical protein
MAAKVLTGSVWKVEIHNGDPSKTTAGWGTYHVAAGMAHDAVARATKLAKKDGCEDPQVRAVSHLCTLD